jgi:light-regulated signal transduction histidine kinase (bacteriophytochrome)
VERLDVEGRDAGNAMVQSYILTPVRGGDGDIQVAVLVAREPIITDATGPEDQTRLPDQTPGELMKRSVQDIYTSLSAHLSQSREASQTDTGQEALSSLDDIRHIHAILDDLLPCIDSGNGDESPEEVKSSAILSESEQSLGVLIRETGTTVIAGTLPALWTDPIRLRMIFSTLLENAILTRRNEPLIVRVNAKSTGSSWQFSVQDNGVGVDPLCADRLFEFPEKDIFPDAGSMTRIRLAVCRRIIERNGGRIWVDSIPGQGSTFYFTIPLERYPLRHQSVDIARP